ncbi:uncharacterized protein LOC141821659 [Curcuma longa]|uniref:uncharacterized protein LOC141821659 n=1 Tax=Curcuma longa TaxID=136217 RepID=UPI003D9F803D
MADWGPVLVVLLLFVLLSPGLLFQIPGRSRRVVEFGNFHTSGASILVHAIIYVLLLHLCVSAAGLLQVPCSSSSQLAISTRDASLIEKKRFFIVNFSSWP